MTDAVSRFPDGVPELVTTFAPLRAVLALVERSAASGAPVLIRGEPGVGKRHLARVIHHRSGRAGPLVFVDCVAFNERALDREIFGLERPASGIPGDRRSGALEIAAGGTLVLDEICALGQELQAKLLLAFERGFIVRGGKHQASGASRLICLTHRPLESLAASGRFQQALLERIRSACVELPPLRDRLVDVAALAEHFLCRFAGGSARAPKLGHDAVAALEAHDWPGNVRELRNAIERALVAARDREINAVDLQLRSRHANATVGSAITLDALERAHIEAVLRQQSWHQGRAVEVLGISPKTLYRKMREYGLQRPGESPGVASPAEKLA